MYTIQTNASGTRSMEISEENLQTIEKYALFQHLIDSNGIVDESVLDKLKLNIRSLITRMINTVFFVLLQRTQRLFIISLLHLYFSLSPIGYKAE